MIDKELLSQLGWSEALIGEITRTAEQLREIAVPENLVGNDSAGSVCGTRLFLEDPAAAASTQGAIFLK